MSTKNLNQLLSAANEFDASDLHLVAGVPPAFRVNGEIIIADEDALTEAFEQPFHVYCALHFLHAHLIH